MYRLFIAMKYLTSRFITLAALMTVACGVALLIVILSVMEGFRTDLENRIRGTGADILVESKRYIDLRNPRELESRVQNLSGIRLASPYIETLAMYQRQASAEFFYFFLLGLDLEKEAELGSFNQYLQAARDRSLRDSRGGGPLILPGRSSALGKQPSTMEELLSPAWLEDGLWKATGIPRPPDPMPPPILVGLEAWKRLGLYLGRTVELTSFSPATNRALSGKFVVAGILLSRDYVFDSRKVLMPLSFCADFLELREGRDGEARATGIRIFIDTEEDLNQMKERVESIATVPFVRVTTWREEKASLLQAVKIEKAVVGTILGVLIIFAGFMIFIVLTVQVVEKTRDLGILQSLGSTPLGIARIYLVIGSSVCVLGTVVGAILGVTFSLSINPIQRWIFLLVGFDLFPQDIYYIDHIPVKLAPMDILFIILPTVVASLLASVVPAVRAARKDPVEALRYE